MRTPAFWDRDGALPALLAPAGALYGALGRWRWRRGRPWRAPVPVLCIGNLVAGGAGKTPVVLSLAGRLRAKGRRVHILTRGYGGRARGPLRVDPAAHGADLVGDEALLLAAATPTWMARRRAAAARVACAAGADILLMDDGFQNPSLAKDLSLLVIDGGYGFGNGRLIPAGPLREPVASGLARADAVVLVGADEIGLRPRLPADLPVLQARLAPGPEAAELRNRAVVAFAGIGRPEKFFRTLEALDCELLGRHRFADHHRYGDHELMGLADKADKLGALLVTTAKDAVRLPETVRALVQVLTIEVAWADEGALDALLARLGGPGGC